VAFSSSDHILSGRLRIDMPIAFGRSVLLPILAEIALANPDLNLALTFTDATSDLLQEDVDLAIRFGALADSSHLIARHLVDQARVICAAPSYLERHGRPQTVRTCVCIVASSARRKARLLRGSCAKTARPERSRRRSPAR
jgi:DNA-binding transcriptional LysR family regulator